MKLLQHLSHKWSGVDYPFLIHPQAQLKFSDLTSQPSMDLSEIRAGDVVALIGDFDPTTILTLLQLIDLGVIVVPLTTETRGQHEYFFESALVDVIIENGISRRRVQTGHHPLIDRLHSKNHAGLVLFSTGTTGRPKAILHDLTLFLKRFETPRPTLRTISFLLFDHIGGLNTLLHTLFNRGVVIAPEARTVDSILETCRLYDVEVLPTTPTFLRMLLLSGAVPERIPPQLKIITYGTERMDQPTLDALCTLLPSVDFRQTFGMSELGIVRVKSKARNSLFMKVGGEGVETQVVNNVLQIRSEFRMLGYLNAGSPFDDAGWYNTGDVVEFKDGYCRVTGRMGEMINVGGLKFMASEVERAALEYSGISLVKATGRNNPITGEHVEISVQPHESICFDLAAFKRHMSTSLPAHMLPRRVTVRKIAVGHRFKKA